MIRHSHVTNETSKNEAFSSKNPMSSAFPTHISTYHPSFISNFRRTKFPVILTIAGVVPSILFIYAFSAMGFGRENMLLSKELDKYVLYILVCMVTCSGIMWLLDISYWESLIGKAVRETLIAILFICTVVIIFLEQDAHPTGPLCAFVVCIPLWFLGIKFFLCDTTPLSDYIRWLTFPLRFASITVTSIWLHWILIDSDNEWDNKTKLEYSVDLGCKPNFSSLPECINRTRYEFTGEMDTCFGLETEQSNAIVFDTDCRNYCILVYNKCVHAFLLWANPLLAGLALFMLSFICEFLNHRSGFSQRKIMLVTKIYVLLLFTMWCAASLAGAGEGLSRSFFSFALASFTAIGIFSYQVVTLSQFEEEQKDLKNSFFQTFASYLDVFRSLVVITCAPVMFLYILWSALNQYVRKMKFPCSKKLNQRKMESVSSWRMWLTDEALQRIEEFESWDHCKVYKYAIYWGLLYISLEVVVKKFTVSFLSRLIYTSASLPLSNATALIVVAGLFLFILPPVPGGPIYCCSGIVLLSSGRKVIGIFGSIFYACFLSLLMKLAACTIQQKLIGENLSKSSRVRQLVKINSRVIRALKLILAEEGLSIAKISILVGGPDWPTSVLCGILRMELIPVLIGTTPIIIIIIPMVLTGSFTYMASLPPVDGEEQYPWAGTVCAIVAVIASVLQFGSMALAAHFVEKTMTLRRIDIDHMHVDLQVLEADKREESMNEAYGRIQQWNALPLAVQWSLKLSLLTMILSCHLISLFNSQCFADFNLINSNRGNDDLICGFIKPLGMFVLGSSLISCVFLMNYQLWAKRKVMQSLAIAGANFKGEQHQKSKDQLLEGLPIDKNGQSFSEISPLQTRIDQSTSSAQYGTIM